MWCGCVVESSGSVRQGETSTTPAVTTTNGQSVSTIPCSPEDPSSCGPHDACHQVSQTLYVCQCVRGYTRNDTSKLCTGKCQCIQRIYCIDTSKLCTGKCQCIQRIYCIDTSKLCTGVSWSENTVSTQ